jgi:DNA-directed RNA polymerase subunit RPC12/RpoP
MSDLKFACPTCQQHIQADQGYAGMQISCPSCGGKMLVPGTPMVAAVAAAGPAPVYAPPPSAPAYAPPPSVPGPVAAGCPSCGAPLSRGAMLCTKCGYNLATKKRMVAGKIVPPGKGMAPKQNANLFLTPFPYLGLYVVVLAVFFFLARNSFGFKLGYLALVGLFYAVLYVCVVVTGFQESKLRGFMMLFPVFHFRFIFRDSDSLVLKVMYGVLAVGALGILGVFKT